MTAFNFHPIAARYPLLEGEAFERLKESIAASGQRVRIVLFKGKILDGRNRYRACVALGIEPLTEVFEGTDEEAAVYSDVLNLHRRHLSREQVREVIAFKLRAEPHRSDRDIADEVKVSHRTVGAVRKKVADSGGQLAHLNAGERTGRDGKTYTVPHPKPPKVEQRDEGRKLPCLPVSAREFLAAGKSCFGVLETEFRSEVEFLTLAVELVPSRRHSGFVYCRVQLGDEESITRRPVAFDAAALFVGLSDIGPKVLNVLSWFEMPTPSEEHPFLSPREAVT